MRCSSGRDICRHCKMLHWSHPHAAFAIQAVLLRTSGSCAAQSTKGSPYHACRFVVAHGCTDCCGMLVRSSRQLWELFTRLGWCLRVPAHSIILASNFTRIDNLVSRRSGGLEIPALWSSGVLGISKLAGSSPVGRLAADPTEQ